MEVNECLVAMAGVACTETELEPGTTGWVRLNVRRAPAGVKTKDLG